MLTSKPILAYMVSIGTLVGKMAFHGGTHVIRNKSTNTMKIKIGKTIFTATLYDNPTAKTFAALLPITLNLTDLNGNEKYVDLPVNLPVDDYKPHKINDGDIMLFGSSTLVLFYQSFTTPYRYTMLGKIDDTSGIEAAFGSGNVELTFEQ